MRGFTTIFLLGLFPAVVLFIACDRGGLPSVTVYKTPTCGCCTKWVDHLRGAGLDVTEVNVSDLQQVRAKSGAPPQFSSCHTALVDGYAVVGHVPVEDILRLLEERPQVAGLAVPGMPIGSPGMEGPDPQNYVVYAFEANGRTSPFASHGP